MFIIFKAKYISISICYQNLLKTNFWINPVI